MRKKIDVDSLQRKSWKIHQENNIKFTLEIWNPQYNEFIEEANAKYAYGAMKSLLCKKIQNKCNNIVKQ